MGVKIYSDDELAKLNPLIIEEIVAASTHEIMQHEIEIAYHRQKITELEAEIARRQLAAYWAAHPELTPVNVGDKLVLTTALFAFRQQTGGWPKYEESRVHNGDECKVVSMDNDFQWFTIEIADWQVGNVPMDVVQHMRRAYLAAHGDEETTR